MRLTFILLAAFMTAASAAAGLPVADMKVTYNAQKPNMFDDSLRLKSDEFVLQIAPGESRFYSLRTEFHDSLAATPGGEEMISNMMLDALRSSGGIKTDAAGNITSIRVDRGVIENAGVPRRGETVNVYKHHDTAVMDVYDRMTNMRGNPVYAYTVDMGDIEWEPGDSVTEVLGYECQQATATYHGRRWTAWYAPAIAVAEGPWQLNGLPGLILKAETDGGEYRFTATGLHNCSEPIKGLPGDPAVERTTRREFLSTQRDLLEHPSRSYGIPASSDPVMVRDFIETDYR